MLRNKAAEGVDYSAVFHKIAMGRLGTASEMADVMPWMLSDRSSYVTAQTIIVDGGFLIAAAGKPG
jgi:3-oxoacyl-[acyl-carrier protein] reductase